MKLRRDSVRLQGPCQVKDPLRRSSAPANHRCDGTPNSASAHTDKVGISEDHESCIALAVLNSVFVHTPPPSRLAEGRCENVWSSSQHRRPDISNHDARVRVGPTPLHVPPFPSGDPPGAMQCLTCVYIYIFTCVHDVWSMYTSLYEHLLIVVNSRTSEHFGV